MPRERDGDAGQRHGGEHPTEVGGSIPDDWLTRSPAYSLRSLPDSNSRSSWSSNQTVW